MIFSTVLNIKTIQKISEEKSEKSKALKLVPNQSNYTFPEGQGTASVKTSTLRASPNKLPFATTGGVQTVSIANNTKSRKAFKVSFGLWLGLWLQAH